MSAEIVTREPQPAAVRASDAEREHVVRILGAAAAQGMLRLDEADERMADAYAAQTRNQLAPLTADLPEGGRRLLENTPEARTAARTGFLRHLITVAVLACALVTAWILSDARFFWPFLPLVFMSLSVVGHAQRIGVLPRRRW